MDKFVLLLNIIVDEVKYKIFLVGRSGIGKISIIVKLLENEILVIYSEILGNYYLSVYVVKERIFFFVKMDI